MKFYLSSYKFGKGIETLRSMMPPGCRMGHINNARDYSGADPLNKRRQQEEEMEQLAGLGAAVEPLDLKGYFSRPEALKEKLLSLSGIWVSGGNTFVLRQAMRLSGFDEIIKDLARNGSFLYAGYSAGICILSTSLRSLHIVDDPSDHPYPGIKETIWEGLGFFDHDLLPHYDSDHPESPAIDKTAKYCIDNRILFIALRDGDYIAIDQERQQ